METTETEPQERPDPDPSTRLRLDSRALRLGPRAVVAVVVVVLLAGGLLAWAPWGDDGPGEAAMATMRSRDAATRAATEALVTLNTSDPRQSRQTLDDWLRLSGGALHRDLGKERARIVRRMRRSGTSMTAKVLETAVSSVDPGAGRATVLGVVEINSTPRRGESTTSVRRFRVLMQHLGSTWRITYLETVKAPS